MHELSQFTLGRHSLFFPDLYGPHANEPADLAWVVNKCAILMHMTEGGKPYAKKCGHNLGQLSGWLKAWKAGAILSGTTLDGIAYQFPFDSVDHVIGISVVDGGKVYCEYHHANVAKFENHKLSVSATLSGKVMMALAKHHAGPRDILGLLTTMAASGDTRFSEDWIIDVVTANMQAEIQQIATEFSHIHISSKHGATPPEESVSVLAGLRATPSSNGIAMGEKAISLLADLKARDSAWLDAAYRTNLELLPALGQAGPLTVYRKREIDGYLLSCLS